MSERNWKYKKVSELTKVINGLWTGKKPPFINIAVIRNTNFTKDCALNLSNVAYIDVEERHFATRKLLKGDIIIEKSGGSEKQPVGRPILFDIEEGNYSFSNFTFVLRIIDQNVISPSFLQKALYSMYRKGVTCNMQSKTTGLHNLDLKAYNNILIPIPTIQEQTSIVSELDSIIETIFMLQQQLKDLDTLSISLYYHMFGEEVAIENKWGKCCVGDIYKFQYGKGNNIPEDKGDYPCYGSNGIVGHHTTYNNEDAPIIGHIGAYAGIVNWGYGKHYVTYNGVMCNLKDKRFNPTYGYFLLKSQNYLNMAKRGGAQPFVSYDLLEYPKVYIPPFSLQNIFAEIITKIEESKFSINKQIKELQILYSSRMQYWFD